MTAPAEPRFDQVFSRRGSLLEPPSLKLLGWRIKIFLDILSRDKDSVRRTNFHVKHNIKKKGENYCFTLYYINLNL